MRARLRALLGVLAALSLIGCATTAQNNYRTAVAAQQTCCNGLTDPNARNACLTDIPRVQGEETSALNQETFGCVARNFRCDAQAGKATHESAQVQLDCLNDLESTQQAQSQGQIGAKPQ
jgi:hypothetical protein